MTESCSTCIMSRAEPSRAEPSGLVLTFFGKIENLTGLSPGLKDLGFLRPNRQARFHGAFHVSFEGVLIFAIFEVKTSEKIQQPAGS